ncbi:Mitogen-activated protein kinase kinase kinase 20 [Cardamine amara subsp. amara]|uniref:Mitogen-activated protein kinase kinase kinase 20 n=1 Tax=Cardamine amara subsp. amara TaxID=228776 RepID=A0ABD1BI16_CARAN
MEMEFPISVSTYYSRYQYGHLIFNGDSNPPLKNPKYSPTNSRIPPLPEKLSPIILELLRASPNKKKRKSRSSSGIVETNKGIFEAAVKKSSTAVTHRNKRVRKSSSWVKSRLLGKGAYGSVYLATSQDQKTERAIKTAEFSRASSLIDEGRILRRLQSAFVIRCYGNETVREGSERHYNLVLEYCSGQSIADLIEDNQGGLSEIDVKLFATDVVSGLRHVHDKNIIHCDIKPDNLLLAPVDHKMRSNGYLTKIADFGLAMEKGSTEYGNGSGHMRGTTRYMAPEIMRSGIVDYGVDIWAFGCTVLEMLTGSVVWGEHGNLGFDDWVNLIGHSDLIPCIPTWLSEEAQDFLKRCLVKEPGSRWEIDALTYHPFLNSEVLLLSHNGFVYD